MPFSDPPAVGYDQSQNTSGGACTGYGLSAPTPPKGPPGTTSSLFTLALTPTGCVTALTLVVTPYAMDKNGNRLTTQPTFTPATVTLSQSNPNGTFALNSSYADQMLIGCTHTESTGSGGAGGAG